MKILVINCGSSSLKYDLIDTNKNLTILEGQFSGIGKKPQHSCEFSGEKKTQSLNISDHSGAMKTLYSFLKENSFVSEEKIGFDAIGHRVVHGGEKFITPVKIDDEVKKEIRELISLAPLHNPANLTGIELCEKYFYGIPQVAVFDTAFHQTMPAKSYLYGIPYELYESLNIRKYGFHGTSHKYVALKSAEFLQIPISKLKLITCHLGNGASVCAINYGNSIDTTMGLSPLEGLVMGTRCGDIDPSVVQFIIDKTDKSIDDVMRMLNKESGLKGISGVSRDMRELLESSSKGVDRSTIAIKVFVHRLVKAIGSYIAVLGGVDAIVFTGGIGENSSVIRERVCHSFEYAGAILDEDKNLSPDYNKSGDPVEISVANSRVKLLAVKTDEEWMIAKESREVILGRSPISPEIIPIPIGISARHIHLSEEHLKELFGEGHELTAIHDLSQPGQYVCDETLSLKGSKGTIENIRILGPVRKKTQVEISRTDEFALGIHSEIRASGDVENSPGGILIGPKGEIDLKEGVIRALRHIHMTPSDAQSLQVETGDLVRVRVDGARELTFGDVLVRVSNKYRLEMHIDTDEANGADLSGGAVGYIAGIQSTRDIND